MIRSRATRNSITRMFYAIKVNAKYWCSDTDEIKEGTFTIADTQVIPNRNIEKELTLTLPDGVRLLNYTIIETKKYLAVMEKNQFFSNAKLIEASENEEENNNENSDK